MHKDALGSVDTITNESGIVIQRLAYDAFGKRIVQDWINDTDKNKPLVKRGYTGHEHIEEFELIHMNGRIYDPVVGRFLSADIFVPYPFKTQSFNRYSYVRNNPLKYIDPSGYIDEDGMDDSDETDGYGNEFGSEAYGSGSQGNLGAGGSGTNQSGGFDNDGTDGDGYGGDVDGGADSYNDRREERARERQKVQEKANKEAAKKNGEVNKDAIKTSSYINDFIGALSKYIDWEDLKNVGPKATGLLGYGFDLFEFFTAKTTYEKGKSFSGTAVSIGTGFAWGVKGSIYGPVAGVGSLMMGSVVGEKIGEDLFDAQFGEYKDEINSWGKEND